MKHYALSFFLMFAALGTIWASVDPRPLKASAFTIQNNIVIAIGSEDNSKLESVFVLKGAQGIDRSFEFGRIALDENSLVLWPVNSVDKPVVFTLENNPEYKKHLNVEELPYAEVFEGYSFERKFNDWTDADYEDAVSDLRTGKFNSSLAID